MVAMVVVVEQICLCYEILPPGEVEVKSSTMGETGDASEFYVK